MTYTVNELDSNRYRIDSLNFGSLQKAQEYMKRSWFVRVASEDIRVGVEYEGYYNGRPVGWVVLVER